jgi:hypothetical protein
MENSGAESEPFLGYWKNLSMIDQSNPPRLVKAKENAEVVGLEAISQPHAGF